MTIYLAGTGPHILAIPYTGGIVGGTAGVDTAWVSNSVQLGNTSLMADLVPLTTPVTEAWFHHESYFNYPNRSNGEVVRLTNANEGAAFRIYHPGGGGVLAAQRWNGSGWSTVGTSFACVGGVMQYDYYIRATANGLIEVYQDKVKVAEATGDFSAMGQISRMSLGNVRSFGSESGYHSQILVASFPTIFAKVKQSLFTTAGALQQWVGSVADIDENVPNTTDFISTDVANSISTFKAAARDLTGYEVKGVSLQWSAQRAGGASPTKVAPIARIGGINYIPTEKNLSFGNQSFVHNFSNNPATGSPWTSLEAGAETLELGFESRA